MNIAIIQARMASTRLPGKVMKPIAGRPMIWHLWNRLSQAETVDKVVVATGDPVSNAPLEAFCRDNGMECFRGPEDDVLGRVYMAAKQYGARIVTSVTGDCPMVDPRISDKVVREFKKYSPHLCATSPSYTYSNGFGTEVFAFETIEAVHKEASANLEREHLTMHIRRNPDRYAIRFVENDQYNPFADLHLSVDDDYDFTIVQRIFEALLPTKPLFSHADVIEILLAHPEWVVEHPQTPINEGYFKSFFNHPDRKKAPSRRISLDLSNELMVKARKLIPSCTQTSSKGYTQFVQGISPIFAERGAGGLIYDVDGNEFIDYSLGLGAVTLGHCHPEVDEAVLDQVRKGPTHSLPHRLEVELAEVLCDIVPCAEMVRFGKNGTDATSGAIRVARTATRREKILSCGYHGWHDWSIGTVSENCSVPNSLNKLTIPFPYNDLPALETLFQRHNGEVAAVIMEPLGSVDPQPGYLQGVKELAHQNGALLIFNEIATCFRLALGGPQQYFGVIPDLACIGRGMGNGYPISAVLGRRDIMKIFDDASFSLVFGGEAVALAASLTTIKVIERDKAISHSWILGRRLKDGYNYLAGKYGLREYTWCQGLPPKSVTVCKDKSGNNSLVHTSIFRQECIKRGVLFSGVHNYCRMHTLDQIDYTVSVYDEAFKTLRAAYDMNNPESLLEGAAVSTSPREQDY